MQPTRVVKQLFLTCVVMTGVAFAINAAFGTKSLLRIAGEGAPIGIQLAYGVAIGGLLSAVASSAVVFLPFLQRLRTHLIGLLREIGLEGLDPIWLSLCAGIGEEMLFRGALQPLFGLVWTSVIFGVTHFRPRQFQSARAATVAYVASVIIVGMLIGTIYTRIGLIAAIAAHVAWDAVALYTFRYADRASLVDA